MKQAVILAAGEGLRLQPFTASKPKAMLAIAGKPILQHVVEALAGCGLREIVIVAGYRREQVFDHMGDGARFGVSIRYAIQEKQLGTVDALKAARPMLEEEFLVLPGDHLVEAATLAPIAAAAGPWAILVKEAEDPFCSAVVGVEAGQLEAVPRQEEQDSAPERLSGRHLVSTRVYALKREFFDHADGEIGLSDVMGKMLALGADISAVPTRGLWLEVVYPWDILAYNDAILQRTAAIQSGTIEHGVTIKGAVAIGEDCLIRAGSYIVGPVIIGRGCEIGPSACVLPATSIGYATSLGPFSLVRNSVLGSDLSIGAGSVIEDSVIDSGCTIGPRFSACSAMADINVSGRYYSARVGAMMGEGCLLEPGVVATSGSILGNRSHVAALRQINGRLPDGSVVS